jgi:hypothetical protein
LHLNGLGNEVICKQTAIIIDKLLPTENILPICIDWDTSQIIWIAFQNTNICNDLKITNWKDNIDNEVKREKCLRNNRNRQQYQS